MKESPQIKNLMTGLEINSIGGFEELTKRGYLYYELYHQLQDGTFEGHNLYEVYRNTSL